MRSPFVAPKYHMPDANVLARLGICDGSSGQGTNTFLKAGNVMETEIESLCTMRNRFVAEAA